MSAVREIILKAGPAPRATLAPASPTPMPAHTVTNRTPKKTNGPLTGRGGSSKSPGKSKARRRASRGNDSRYNATPRKRRRAVDFENTDSDESDDTQETLTPTKIYIRIVGFDLGMWGFGRARASNEKDPSSVTADLNWPDSHQNQFKNPSIVAFKKDNQSHRAFRNVDDCLIGMSVPPDANKCSFFKASLDKRAKASKFDHPILKTAISKSLVSFSTPQKDEQAALAVLKFLYKAELDNSTQSLTGFDDHPIEHTKFIFVLTHPAACSKAGRDGLEELAQAAGLASRRGDEIKLLSEAQAAAMASFISYQAEVGHDVWRKYFKESSWITVLDIGSLTVDTTTEEIASNDPRLVLKEKITSEGGRCGIVTLHIQLLDFIMKKYRLKPTDLPQTLVGRDTDFHKDSETIVRTFLGDDSAGIPTLRLRLPESVTHADYDDTYGEVVLQFNELKQVFDEYLEYPKKLLQDQWDRALKKGHKIKTTIICGGGSLAPYVWATLRQFCRDNGVKAVRPQNPIDAVCRGAVISQLSDGLLGQRISRAHFGIKYEVDGDVYMKWIIKRGDIIDTTSPKTVDRVAGHFTLGINDILNNAAKFELKIFMYEKDDKDVTDPDDPDVEEIASITVDKSNISKYTQDKLQQQLASLDDDAQGEESMDIEVLLGIDDSGRLYFQVKRGMSSLGKGFLRYDFTKPFL